MMTPELTLLAANAYELVVITVAFFLLVRFILGEIENIADFVRRTWRVLWHDYQGAGYDLAVAFAVILAGKWIRTEAIWDWGLIWSEFPFWRFGLGLVVISVGALCLIRILAPRESYNRWWISTAIAAAVFSAGSVAFKIHFP